MQRTIDKVMMPRSINRLTLLKCKILENFSNGTDKYKFLIL